jgi:hypothetical protein
MMMLPPLLLLLLVVPLLVVPLLLPLWALVFASARETGAMSEGLHLSTSASWVPWHGVISRRTR